MLGPLEEEISLKNRSSDHPRIALSIQASCGHFQLEVACTLFFQQILPAGIIVDSLVEPDKGFPEKVNSAIEERTLLGPEPPDEIVPLNLRMEYASFQCATRCNPLPRSESWKQPGWWNKHAADTTGTECTRTIAAAAMAKLFER